LGLSCATIHSVTGKRRNETRDWLFGEKLAQAREAARLSLRAASEAAGFSTATWTALEKGVKRPAKGMVVDYTPSVTNVVAAAQVVGMDPAEALELAGLDPAAAPNDHRPPTVSQRELSTLIAQLDEETRAAFATILRKMVSGEASVDGGLELPPVGEVRVFDVKRTSAPG
jgi:transcriptional regulator with XRE-family HTH domain